MCGRAQRERPGERSRGVTSSVHDGLLALFTRAPALAPELLRSALGVALPAYCSVTPASAELAQAVAIERRADLALLLRDEGGALAAVVVAEFQQGRDPDERYTWPHDYAALRDRWRCEVYLLVATLRPGLARWCRREITAPQLRFQPLVLGPEAIPVVAGLAAAERSPELAVLSAMAHGDRRPELLRTALSALLPLDADRRRVYSDVLAAALGRAARRTLEELMESDYVFRSAYAKRHIAQGRATGKLEALLTVYEERGVAVSAEERARLAACDDPGRLDRWLRLALRGAPPAALADDA